MKKTFLLFAVIALFAGITFYAQAPQQTTQQAPQVPPAGGQRGAPGTENGIAVFQTQCVACHGNPNVDRAPSPSALREMPPERILEALTSGVMKTQGEKLSDQDKRGVAEFMSGRPLGSGKQEHAESVPQ
jgi:mono/diheme cytochrome c family protein